MANKTTDFLAFLAGVSIMGELSPRALFGIIAACIAAAVMLILIRRYLYLYGFWWLRREKSAEPKIDQFTVDRAK